MRLYLCQPTGKMQSHQSRIFPTPACRVYCRYSCWTSGVAIYILYIFSTLLRVKSSYMSQFLSVTVEVSLNAIMGSKQVSAHYPYMAWLVRQLDQHPVPSYDEGLSGQEDSTAMTCGNNRDVVASEGSEHIFSCNHNVNLSIYPRLQVTTLRHRH